MNKSALILAGIAIALAASAPVSAAQKQKKKPQGKQHVKPAAPGVLGTAQLPGDNGKLNQAYTMGQEGKLNFSLRSAEYTAGRLVIGTAHYSPTKEQKLLVLRFTIQNPNHEETQYRFDSVSITAVDSQEVNHEWIADVAKPDETQHALDVSLKPGQKVEVVSAVLMPADASAPKLMVRHRSGGKVLRYDLHGLVKPLAAAFADPEDKTFTKIKHDIPAEKGAFVSLDSLDLKVVSAVLSPDKLGSNAPAEGNQFLVVTLVLRNGTNEKQNYRFDTLGVRLLTADGEKDDHTQNLLLKTSRNEDADGTLDPGESYTCRLVVEVSRDSKPAKLMLWQGESHPYVFDIADAK